MQRKKTGWAFLILGSFIFSRATFALPSTLTGSGGYGVGGGDSVKLPTPILGGQYTLKVSADVELGGSYDHTFLTYKDGAHGALDFYSAVVRYLVPGLQGAFVDGKIGLVQRTLGNSSSGFALGASLDVGYPLNLNEKVTLSPLAGVHCLPNAPSAIEPSPSGLIPQIGVQLSMSF